MPSSVVKSYAEKSGKSIDEVEKIWSDLKAEADGKFPEKNSEYWSYVSGGTRRALGLKKEDFKKSKK